LEGALRKPLFIHAQDWYKPAICVDCPEFKFVALPEGAVAYCNRVEDDRSCIFQPVEEDRNGTKEPGLQTLLDIEVVQEIQAD